MVFNDDKEGYMKLFSWIGGNTSLSVINVFIYIERNRVGYELT